MRNLFSVLLITIFAASCTLNNAKVNNDLKKHFDAAGVEGTFAMLNNQSGSITYYNMLMDTQKVSPVFTFNILNTLIGVESSQVTGKDMQLPVEGKQLSLTDAWQQQNTAFFQEVARRSGEQNMRSWIDSLKYGNQNMNGPIDSFWFNNTLKISPDEQLGLMFQLYFDKLPFAKFGQQMVRDLMLKEENNEYKLSYVTGSGSDESQMPIDWVTGWIEENKHVYFFVTFIRGNEKGGDVQNKSWQIAESILQEMEFFKGIK